MTAAQDDGWTAVEDALLADEDDDVSSGPEGLLVKGRLFAARSASGDLAVQLPSHRADDLVDRGVAEHDEGQRDGDGAWVVVADPEDWVELATEAHQFVGELPVGRDS